MPSEPQHYASVQVTSRARRGSGAGGLIRSSSRPAANPQPSRGVQLPLDAMPHRQELGGHPPLGGHRAVRSAGLSCARSERRPLLLSGVLTWRAHPTSQHRDRDGGMQPQLVPNAPLEIRANLRLALTSSPPLLTPATRDSLRAVRLPAEQGSSSFFFLGSRRDARAMSWIGQPDLEPHLPAQLVAAFIQHPNDVKPG